jgi:purine-binding chemotaxis protein CheW
MTPLPADHSADQEAITYLLCRAGGHLCAVPLDRVVETMRVQPIESLAGAPAIVRGMSMIRGAPVPVIELARLLDTSDIQSQRLITINIGSRVVALLADTVLSIRAIAPHAVRELPPLFRGAAGEVVSAIGTLDSELLLFLNDMRLIADSSLVAADPSVAQS